METNFTNKKFNKKKIITLSLAVVFLIIGIIFASLADWNSTTEDIGGVNIAVLWYINWAIFSFILTIVFFFYGIQQTNFIKTKEK